MAWPSAFSGKRSRLLVPPSVPNCCGGTGHETSPPQIFCVSPRALPRCRPCRASHGRKPIRRGRCADRRLCGRRSGRHHRAPDGPMAVGAARPAIRHREPAGRRQQYRHRGGRACAAGRLYASLGRPAKRDQRDALRQAQFQFHPRHCAGREHRPRAQRHGGQSIGSGQDGSRVHRLCQGQSGQDQHGVGRHRDSGPCRPASCSR